MGRSKLLWHTAVDLLAAFTGEDMDTKLILSAACLFSLALTCSAEETTTSKPVELELLKASVGVWDAEIEVWPQGLDAPSLTFTGVETNRAYGEYWIASDFDSEYMGQTMKLHSIIGYDQDQSKLIGTTIDHGIYAAKMTGDYDAKTKTVRWRTEAKDMSGNPMIQRTLVQQKTDKERVLTLMVPVKGEDDFRKFMQIRFLKRD